jgi:hypothetical protein
MGISNWSCFHRCPTECTFSFENGPETEIISNASEYLGDIINIKISMYACWDNFNVKGISEMCVLTFVDGLCCAWLYISYLVLALVLGDKD